MKKIISLLITLFIISETALAFTQEDLDKGRYNTYKKYEELFKNGVMENGEPLLDYIDTTKILPHRFIKEGGTDGNFKNYTEGKFSEEMSDWFYGFACGIKDKNDLVAVIDKYDYKSDTHTLTADSSKNHDNWALDLGFDDEMTVDLLTKEGVRELFDMQLFYMSYGIGGVFVYLNTDKGEYILPIYVSTSTVYAGEPFKANTLYKANDMVEAYYEIDKALQEQEAEDRRKEQSETRWVLQDGEAVKITPVPTKAPAVTAEPETTPKATVEPTPIPTVTPDVTPKPTLEPTETATPKQDKTLTVRTKGKITITIDTDEVEFPDAQPFVDENDRTQAPIRTVAEMLNSTVSWDNDTRTVTITNKDGDVITLIIDSPIMNVNGKAVYMDTQATIKDNRTYIPVRFIAEAMNMSVKWSY